MLADAGRHDLVVTVEDGIRQGGAGMFIAEELRASLSPGTAPAVHYLGIPRAYIPQGKPDRILARLGLDGPGVARTVRDIVAAPPGPVTGSAVAPPVPVRPASVTGRAVTPPAPVRPASVTAQEAPD